MSNRRSRTHHETRHDSRGLRNSRFTCQCVRVPMNGTPRDLGVNRAPGRVDLRPRGRPSSPVRGIEDQDSRRATRSPRGYAPPVCPPEQAGFPVVLACRRLPVLVVERGGCERSSPAGHGWPAEWARKEAFKLWATFDVGRIAKNPPDSRTFASLDRSSHPQTERRAR
jgi:hypothetical protein